MSTQPMEISELSANPLDLVEEIVMSNEWPFDRPSERELVVEFSGRWCDYRLYFGWISECSALQFSCAFDLKVPRDKSDEVCTLLSLVNEKMWVGHFNLLSDDGVLAFRHAALLRGVRGASVEQLEDIVDIALSECERFYPAFQFVIWGGKSARSAIEAALIETVGEA